MLGQFGLAYLLGALTFWPLVAGLVLFLLANRPEASPDAPDADAERPPAKPFAAGAFASMMAAMQQSAPDLESDVEASCWVRLSPTFISSADPYDEAEGQPGRSKQKQPASTARSSLQKFMSGSGFFGGGSSPGASSSRASLVDAAAGAGGSGSGSPGPGGDDAESISSFAMSGSQYAGSSGELNGGLNGGLSGGLGSLNGGLSTGSGGTAKPKSVAKCPRYWAVVRGGQLQLFEDKLEQKLVDFIPMSQFIVTLWPQNLQEFELFYRRYPVALLSRTLPEGVVSLDMYPGLPPRDAFYFYVANPVEKEDLYFALIKASKGGAAASQSLGPRDPDLMARPIRPRKAETQLLQSSIWSGELPQESQWLNALLGRVFLGLKESKLADDYLRHKFSTKLKPISDSSNIIGDIEVKDIKTGSTAPFVWNVKLKELSPDGNLVLSAGIRYAGGFKVILATSVKLAAVTSLTTVEIPIELAATLRSLEGSILIRVKPAPSERIWYSFESMPDVDLHIEPAVYNTHISLSVVTKFIRSKMLESLRETLVMPYMDDVCFHDTSSRFYRGGIWETPSKESASARMDKDVEALLEQQQRLSSATTSTASTTNGGGLGSGEGSRSSSPRDSQAGSSVFGEDNSGSSRGGTPGAPQLPPPAIAPRIRKRFPSSGGSGASSGSALEASSSVMAPSASSAATLAPTASSSSTTAVQRLSNWVKKKRSAREIAGDAREPEGVASSDVESMLSMSPGSVRRRAPSTTQVTADTAVSAGGGSRSGSASASPLLAPESSPARKQTARRKPVPGSSVEPPASGAAAAVPQLPQLPPTIDATSSGRPLHDVPYAAAAAGRVWGAPSSASFGSYSGYASTPFNPRQGHAGIHAGSQAGSRRVSHTESHTESRTVSHTGQASSSTLVGDRSIAAASGLDSFSGSGAAAATVAVEDPAADAVSPESAAALSLGDVPALQLDEERLSFPPLAAPSTTTTRQSTTGELSIEHEALARRGSVSSAHRRRPSHEAASSVRSGGSVRSGSVRSGGSAKSPALPPRQRRVVPLSNVPPERAAKEER